MEDDDDERRILQPRGTEGLAAMFLTPEQVEQLQEICEQVAASRTRSGKVIINIHNNMPRTIEKEVPVYDEDHVLIGATRTITRVVLPEEEINRQRQKNRLDGKVSGKGQGASSRQG